LEGALLKSSQLPFLGFKCAMCVGMPLPEGPLNTCKFTLERHSVQGLGYLPSTGIISAQTSIGP